MTYRFSDVAAFVEAAEAGGFSAAAVRLNLSRSAVGKTVARLEARLGTRLFHRTTRTQSLTEDGQAFYERCLRALAELRAGEATLESGRREVAGKLRVTMPVLFGRLCVVPILAELAKQHPKLELDLNFTDRVVDLLEDGFDLAIRNGILREDAGITVRRLAYNRMGLCAAPSYIAARGAPRSPAEIAGHDCITYCRAGQVRAWHFQDAAGGVIEIMPPTRLRFDDLEAIADLACAGLGIAFLPCWLIAERVRTGKLVRLIECTSVVPIPTYAAWPTAPQLPMRVRLAIDAIARALPAAMEV